MNDLAKELSTLAMNVFGTDEELATRIAKLAELAGEHYVLASDEGEIPTPAQGLALARFLRPHFRPANGGSAYASVARGGFDLPDGYIRVRLADGYQGGIARDGRTST